MTRAALRAYAQDEDAISIHEDKDADALQIETTEKEGPPRPALTDITEDNYSTTTDEVSELKQSTRGRKPKASKRKGKQATEDNDEDAEVTKEVTEQATSANNEGCEQPEAEEPYIEASETTFPATAPAATISESEEITAETPKKDILTTISKTPKFDPVLHAPESQATSAEHQQEDSFVDSIKTRFPMKLSREPSRDSFIDSIKSRSPARQASRIEDSVEAMDALEDAIEEIAIKMPHIEDIDLESLVKARQAPSQGSPSLCTQDCI